MGGWTREYLLSLPDHEYAVLVEWLNDEAAAVVGEPPD
jgi:hypothetical protein